MRFLLTCCSCAVFPAVMCQITASSRLAADEAKSAAQSQPADNAGGAAGTNPAGFQPLTISPEITVITKPLTKDGRVDYVEYINQEMSKAVTPEKNAAIPLMNAVGPGCLTASDHYKADFYKRLGIAPLPEDGAYFKGYTPANADTPFTDFDDALNRPWLPAEFPDLDQWLAQNEGPLNALVKGLERPQFYLPLASTSKNPEPLIAVLLPVATESRAVGRALVIRAQREIAVKNFAAARRDLLASHRLARHVGQGPTLIDNLVGIAIEAIAIRGDAWLMAAEGVPANLYRDYRSDLAKLPDSPSVARTIDRFERLMFVDALQLLARNPGGEEAGLVDDSGALGRLVQLTGPLLIDWDGIARKGHGWYDRLVAAMQQPTYARRMEALDALQQELGELRQVPEGKELAMKALFGGGLRKQISDQMGNLMVALLMPALNNAYDAEARCRTHLALGNVGLSLAEYRKLQGEYPETLDQLVPGQLKSLPTDPYTDQSFIYRRTETGYLLYSPGRNQKDDNGKDYREAGNRNEGDVVLEMPPRKLKN